MIERFAEWLPVGPQTPRLTLHEGGTPLIAAPRLAEWVGVAELYLKHEGLNPTGSFKDRGMVVAVAKAVEAGATAIVCASTGNTAASAAAYGARAGLRASVLLPADKVAPAKLAQAIAHGATVLAVRASFEVALQVTQALAGRPGVAVVNSINPDRIEGQTTAAYEINEDLGGAPDVVALPVGNGGNITAYWLGFCRYAEAGPNRGRPRMFGVQAAGAAPLVHGHAIAEPETIASAIRIGDPASRDSALAAAHESDGAISAASDDEILEAYREIARREGVFCEPASAAGVAGLRAAVQAGRIERASRCVCILTGHGLKDPAHALPRDYRAEPVSADPDVIARAMGVGEG